MDLTKEEIILIHSILLAPRFQTLPEAQALLPLAVKIQEVVNKWNEEKKNAEEAIKVSPKVENGSKPKPTS